MMLGKRLIGCTQRNREGKEQRGGMDGSFFGGNEGWRMDRGRIPVARFGGCWVIDLVVT